MFKQLQEVQVAKPHFLGIHLTRNYFYFSAHLLARNRFDEKFTHANVLYDEEVNKIRIVFNKDESAYKIKYDSNAVRINCRISNFMPVGRYLLIDEKEDGEQIEMTFALVPKGKKIN